VAADIDKRWESSSASTGCLACSANMTLNAPCSPNRSIDHGDYLDAPQINRNEGQLLAN